MTGGYESPIDKQIREAQERGEFDNLPGMGKPLPGSGERLGEDWWLKQWLERENIGGVLPTSLKLRKECEELMETLAQKSSESKVREYVLELNERISKAMRGPIDGPPVVLKPFDIEAVVQEWRERRAS